MKFKGMGDFARGSHLVCFTVSARSLHKMSDIDFCALLYSTEAYSHFGRAETDLSTEQQEKIIELLMNYNFLFAEPSTLPPTRTQDHMIPLLLSTILVNVRPYRHNFTKKKMKWKGWQTKCSRPTSYN